MGLSDRKPSRFDLQIGTSNLTSHHQSPMYPNFDREGAGTAASDARDAALRGNTETAQHLQDKADRHRDNYLHPYPH